MSDYPMLISNKLHSFRNFMVQRCKFSIELKNFPPDLSGEPREPVIRKMRILMQRKQRRHGQAAGPGGWIRPLRVQKKRIGFYGSAIIE